MAFGTAALRVLLTFDSKGAAQGIDQAATKTKGLGSSIKGLAGAVATGFAVTKVLDFGKASVTAAQDAAVSTQRLEAVFKSMGDTTGQSAKHAAAYASTLSKQIGVEDDVIMAGQAILATFKDVSSATAISAGVFDRATAAAADLAAAGFGSIQSNSVQLGKALQDPIKGITALAKSGVTFTEAQKQQIKVLTESGDLLGAQKIVLAGVESQVKGTAAATATSADKQKVAYGEMQEAIGTKLLPVIIQLQTTLMHLFDFIGANAGWVLPVIAGVAALIAILKTVTLVSQGVAAMNALVGASWFAAVWPVLLIIAAVALLIGIFILLYNKCAWFRDAVQTAMRAAATAFSWILTAAQTVWNWIRSNWPLLLAIITGPFGIAVLIIARNWQTILSGAQAVLGWFRGFAGAIAGALAGVAGAIVAPFVAGFNAVRGAIEAAVGWITDRINSLKAVVSSAISGAKDVYNAFARTWNAIEVTMPSIDTKIPGIGKVGGFTLGLPDIPLLAQGAYVNRAMLAVLGEGRGGEYVLPEAKLAAMMAGRGNTYNVTVKVDPAANRAEVGRAVVDAIRAFERAAGSTWRTA